MFFAVVSPCAVFCVSSVCVWEVAMFFLLLCVCLRVLCVFRLWNAHVRACFQLEDRAVL